MTAFPADADSNLFEGPYPEFFQVLAHFAYPGDVRRIREAHSEWSARNPCEYPPLYGEHGWDAPRTGEAFKSLWLKLEGGAVRSWRRRGKDGPYETIGPFEWRRRREDALAAVKAAEAPGATDAAYVKVPSFAPNPVIPSLEPRQIRPHTGTGDPLGDLIDRRIPERDFFIILVLNVAFLRNVVVSRDDILKRASAAPSAAVPSATETGRLGGKKSGEVRRKSRPWVPHAEEIAFTVDSNLSNEDIALAISDRWKRADVNYPGHRTLVRFVAQLRARGRLPPRKPRPKASKPNRQHL